MLGSSSAAAGAAVRRSAAAIAFLLLACCAASSQAKLLLLGDLYVGKGPRGLTVAGDFLYVALETDRAIAKVANYLTAPNITLYPFEGIPQDIVKDVGSGPEGIFFVSLFDANAIQAIDTTNGQLLQDWVIGAAPTLFSNSIVGNAAYIPSENSDFITAFDIKEGAIVRSYRTGRRPQPAEVGRLGREAFVPNLDEDTVSVINLVNGLDNKIKLPSGAKPTSLALDSRDDFVIVVGSGLNQVYFVNLTTKAIQHEVSLDSGSKPTYIALSPDQSQAFVANYGKGTVSVIDIATQQVVEVVTVGNSPSVVRVFGDRLFVSNQIDGSVTVFQIV